VVAGQVALSLALLAAAGLFVRGAVAAGRAAPGYRLDGQVLRGREFTLEIIGVVPGVRSRLTVIVLANLDGWNPIDLARTVAGLYRPALRAPRMMAERTETNPELGARLLGAATVLAKGAGDTSMFTEGQRMALVAGGRPDLAAAPDARTSFDFLGEDDVRGRGLRLDGMPVARVRYYRIRADAHTTPISFFLTSGGFVAWIQQGAQ
jgi:hypothetical protein